ncbi:protein kinase [Streptomyces sp. NPDC005438]|uniref:protein kinase domain-containing protein n=1 Tax=Streptomyces sp. NPDC005438 TaxID=3156880 RepID=UPI00339EBD0F
MRALGVDDPRTVGAYRLLGKLGEGGMGCVYLARSDRGRTVAVKVVRGELAGQRDFRTRFDQEVRAATRVGGEWTAPVLDADTEAATPWVATGYIAGPSLTEVVDESYGPLPDKTVRALATGLVKALHAIHGAGLIHRDLKPSNILITIDGPKVIDFGIARALDALATSAQGVTQTGAVIGSPGFMSPEQVRGTRVTPASDVFCLGAVLAYAATGRMPFGTADSGIHTLLFRIAEEEPDLEGLDGPLRRLVEDCLRKDPEQRPTVDQLLARTAGDVPRTWLPGEVLADLGRHAVELLNVEDPEGQPASGANGLPTPPTAPPTPSVPSTPPTAGVFSPPASPYQSPYAAPSPYATNYAATGYQSMYGGGTGRPLRDAVSPRLLGQLTSWLMGLLLVLLLIDGFYKLHVYNELDSALQFVAPNNVRGYAGWKDGTDVLRALILVAEVAVITSWVVWFRRLYINAEVLGSGQQLRHSSAMAVGGWFIPVVAFFLPKQMANDIWNISLREPHLPWNVRPSRALLNGWWTVWLGHAVINTCTIWANWTSEDDVHGAQGLLALQAMGDWLGVVAALLAVLVVVRLSGSQERRLAGMG